MQNLMPISAVAAYLSCGEKPARKWLDKHKVPIALDLGRGRGLGLRWRFSDIEEARQQSIAPKVKPYKLKKGNLEIFDLPIKDQLNHFLGLTKKPLLN